MAKKDNIPGHPGYYISKRGILYSRIQNGNHIRGDTWHKRNRYSLSNGKYVKYYRTEIQGTKYYVHRLVALAWVPNPDNKPCVGHKDNNPFNNRASNLYWCTQKENMEQMVRDGRSLRGEDNPVYKYRNLDLIGRLFAEGKGIVEIAKITGYSKHIVQRSIQVLFNELWQQRRK